MKFYLLTLLAISMLFTGCEKNFLGTEPENNPKSNFEILWNTLDKNYALFPVKNVNWDSLRIAYGSKISDGTTDEELWNIMILLLSNLNDGHTKLFNTNYTKYFNSSEISKRKANDFSLTLIKSQYLDNNKTVGAGLITYGKIKNKNIGYIHIASFAANGTASDWANDIDIAIKELADCDAIILDVRNNGGGLRITEDIIASAFVDRNITYLYQRVKTGAGHNDFSDLMPVKISQRIKGEKFTKRNLVLTNRFSASGAEYFTQIFKYVAYSKQVGDTTFGAFGDIISVAELPNGWTFTYPCRLTTTPEGKCLEGKGIVPDYLIENKSEDILSGNDKVIHFAIEYLSNSKTSNK